MRVPTVGSVVKVRTSYSQGPRMIPPRPAYHEYEGKVLSPYKWLNDRQFCMSGDNDWPIRVITMDFVQDLNILSGDFKNIETDVKTWEVSGSKGNKYVVTRNSQGWSCTCTGFQFRKQCKHVSELSTEVSK
jgi:hypothetical protein